MTIFPKDWFNLTERQMADFGAMFFLAALMPYYTGRTLAQVFYAFETPLRLGQYYIFRDANGFPRGFTTFAGMSVDAERRYTIDETPLKPEDWTSGDSFWLVDFVMPFGQVRQVVEKLKAELPHPRVRANRIVGDMSTARIVEWTRAEDESVTVRIHRKSDFEKLLGAG